MSDKNKLLELRRKNKAKKPDFIRQDSHKKKRLKKKWRRPKGIHSKIRLNKRGYRTSVSKGYSSPKPVRGLHRTGLKSTRIYSVQELDKINPKQEGILISSNVGLMKKIIIAKKAKEKNITVLNIKEIEKWLKETEEKISRKKEIKKKKKETKIEKKKELEKKAEEKKEEKLTEKLTEEEKKQKEKEEKDRIITKKQ